MDRTAALNSLVELAVPLPVALSRLGKYPFDSEVALVELRNAHIVGCLQRFVSGELSAAQVGSWANAVECRDDIDLAQYSLAREAIHELANPLLTQPLTQLRAQWWLARLHRDAT
jgi:hypothetical protein